MKGGGDRPLSPRHGLGSGHGGSPEGSPAGAVLCAQHLGIPPVPVSPGRLRLAKVTGPRRAPSFGDPSAVGVHRELGDKEGSPNARAGGAGESSGISGTPVQHRQAGLFAFFVNTILCT